MAVQRRRYGPRPKIKATLPDETGGYKPKKKVTKRPITPFEKPTPVRGTPTKRTPTAKKTAAKKTAMPRGRRRS